MLSVRNLKFKFEKPEDDTGTEALKSGSKIRTKELNGTAKVDSKPKYLKCAENRDKELSVSEDAKMGAPKTNITTKSSLSKLHDHHDGPKVESIQIPTIEKPDSDSDSNPPPNRSDNNNFLTVPQIEFLKTSKPRASLTNDSDLAKLKSMTERLNLTTQRPSYVEWKTKYLEKPDIVKSLQRKSITTLDEGPVPWTAEKEKEMGVAIGWIRNELAEMRNLDQQLARTLVTLRHEIHSLKLELSCEAHRMTIDDVTDDLEEEDILMELSDCPLGVSPLAPLKKFGVTRMNIERRRFSLC